MLGLLSLLGLLGAWQLAGSFGLLRADIVPTPADLIAKFFNLAQNGYADKPLYVHILASVRRAALGFTLGVVAGVPVGLLMGRSGVVGALLGPVFGILRAIPAIALVPLFILYFGIGELSKVLVIFTTAFYYIVLNSAAGAAATSELLLKAGMGVGLRGRHLFMKVVLPASLPFILAGLRVAGAISWALLVASELIAAQEGLGYIVMDAGTFFDVRGLYVGIAMIGILGLSLELFLVWLERRVVHWRGK
jgi:ABC-type nitrate/sulfonate/bicarbonate transport system permease component